MASFDPTTAYAEAYRYIPGIQDATLHYRLADGSDSETAAVKVHREDLTTSDFRNAAMSMAISTADTLFCLWKTDDEDADPTPNDTLVLGLDTWVLQKVREVSWGPIWLVSAQKGVANSG